MLKTINYEGENIRLDVYLASIYEEYTRSYIKTLISNDKIKVNDNTVKSGYNLKLNDVITVYDIEKKEIDILPKKLDINIVYEDADIIIINKQKGMVVHPGNGNYTDTLVNGLLYSHKDKLSGINDVIRPGIVHRIDKDTTGILVVAKNDNAHKKLSDQFKEHSINRKYIAIVKGIIKEDELKIDKPIGRDIKDRKRMDVTNKNSKNAVTNIKVLKRYYNSKMTLIEAKLETGRTHQIRVHMKYLGHPLLGDLIYGNKENKFKCETHILHAKVLGFIHPSKNEYVEFDSRLPKEFEEIIDKLNKIEGIN